MGQVYMNPAPIHQAAKVAIITSGQKARATSVALNPAPRHIRISEPRLIAKYGYEAGIMRAFGRLAHLFEDGTSDHFVTPGVQQGFKRLGKYHTKTGDYFIKPSMQSRRYASSYQSATVGALGWGSVRTGEQSRVAIRFNRGDRGFYRGLGFRVGGMKEKPFMDPGLRVWVAGFPVEMSKAVARVSTVEGPKVLRMLGFAA